jgi:hypothetical protein
MLTEPILAATTRLIIARMLALPIGRRRNTPSDRMTDAES